MKSHLFTTGLVCPFFLFFLSHCTDTSPSTTLGSRGPVVPGAYDNASESPLLNLIEQSSTSLDIEIYEMHDPDVIAALTRAAQRGVKVRAVVEPKPVGVACDALNPSEDLAGVNDSCKEKHAVVDGLRGAGVTLVPFAKELCGQKGRCYQHGKIVIADKNTVLVSTGNFNSSSLCNAKYRPSKCNRDISVIAKDPTAINVLSQIIEGDLKGEKYNLEGLVTTPAGEDVTVSPDSFEAIMGFLGKAQTSIHIQAQYLTVPAMNQALVAAAQRGIKVNITLASNCAFTKNITPNVKEKVLATYQPMVNAGIDIKFFTSLNKINSYNAYMHSKLIIIDGKEAWVGSINGSETSFHANREFGLIFQNPAWVAKLTQLFHADHQSPHNEGLVENLACKAESGITTVQANGTEDSLDPGPFWEGELPTAE